jgi:SpoVK/Ycf46/Vps4 family AAA+-type ATPase
MASAEQIKALLQSHLDGDDSHFHAVAMQVAAHEAKLGHGKLARELRALIDEAKKKKASPANLLRPVPISQPKGELSALLTASFPKLRLSDIVLDSDIHGRLTKIIKEQRQAAKLRSHGLVPRKKMLFIGPPGTGKTMSASVLAGELGLPLFVVRLEGLITKFMGETAAKLRLIFDALAQTRGVYFFDEFDSIGSQRGQANDVGEIRRILNSFLQMIEQDDSDSLILAATNHPNILDYALFRRFDDVIQFKLPDKTLAIKLIKTKLAGFPTSRIIWKNVAACAEDLSFADIAKVCEDAIKDAIINDQEKVTQKDITRLLLDKKANRPYKASLNIQASV